MRPMHASFAALSVAMMAMPSSNTMVLQAAARTPEIKIPKSAQGNGSRGHPNNKGFGMSIEHKKRRRKLAKVSRRKNR